MGLFTRLFPAALAETAPLSDLAVVLLGVGVVFFGLLTIVGFCALMGRIFRSVEEGKKTAPPAPAPVCEPDPAERGAILAAICAVIAEELGTDVTALRVRSFRKIN